MESSDIDKTHIIALREMNGQFQNVSLPITRPEQFIAELKAMIDNPNRTVWDMQCGFSSRFQKTNGYLDYIHPYSYASSYVRGIFYPSLYRYDELQKSWADAGKAARKSYFDSCKKLGVEPDINSANQEEINAINKLKRSQKTNFIDNAMRWINASCYAEAASLLNCDNSVKMYSKENIGWSGFIHQINDDIKISLKTNFGFGNAAYFLMAVQYKGLDILPYSYIVKYYKAGMADIVRCTRSYSPCRESWSAAFDFISDFINNSIADPEGFVKTYIIREVKEMMRGLEAIAINPMGIIDHIGSREADPCVINIRPMFNDDRVRMQSYPDETPILFKVEKIIGALDFLNSLWRVAKEIPTIQPYIDRLLEINVSLYPEIQVAIAKINDKIEIQDGIRTNLETEIAKLTEKLIPFEDEISQLRAASTEENPFYVSNYELSHPEYKNLKGEKNDLQSQLYKVYRLISDFKSFISILNRSLTKIMEVKQLIVAA